MMLVVAALITAGVVLGFTTAGWIAGILNLAALAVIFYGAFGDLRQLLQRRRT